MYFKVYSDLGSFKEYNKILFFVYFFHRTFWWYFYPIFVLLGKENKYLRSFTITTFTQILDNIVAKKLSPNIIYRLITLYLLLSVKAPHKIELIEYSYIGFFYIITSLTVSLFINQHGGDNPPGPYLLKLSKEDQKELLLSLNFNWLNGILPYQDRRVLKTWPRAFIIKCFLIPAFGALSINGIPSLIKKIRK